MGLYRLFQMTYGMFNAFANALVIVDFPTPTVPAIVMTAFAGMPYFSRKFIVDANSFVVTFLQLILKHTVNLLDFSQNPTRHHLIE